MSKDSGQMKSNSIRRNMIRVAAISVAISIALDVYRHSVAIAPTSTSGSHLWIDYGRLQIRVGSAWMVDGLELSVLWWPTQDWSWGGPGHEKTKVPKGGVS